MSNFLTAGEYDIFLLVEELHVLDIIRKDLALWMNSIALANSVSNRRKSRAGVAGNCTSSILFIEHGLRHFATQAITAYKKPDFLPPQAFTTILSFL